MPASVAQSLSEYGNVGGVWFTDTPLCGWSPVYRHAPLWAKK